MDRRSWRHFHSLSCWKLAWHLEQNNNVLYLLFKFLPYNFHVSDIIRHISMLVSLCPKVTLKTVHNKPDLCLRVEVFLFVQNYSIVDCYNNWFTSHPCSSAAPTLFRSFISYIRPVIPIGTIDHDVVSTLCRGENWLDVWNKTLSFFICFNCDPTHFWVSNIIRHIGAFSWRVFIRSATLCLRGTIYLVLPTDFGHSGQSSTRLAIGEVHIIL